MNTLFSIAYLPPVSYILKCREANVLTIDKHEHFIKQSYRNRCHIYGPNGLQRLVVPVIHENLFRTPISKVKISFETKWNNIHWKSICAAYSNSPFFQYYEDDFKKIYSNPPEELFHFNLALFELLLKQFKIEKEIQFTSEYEKQIEGYEDMREKFHPKKSNYNITPYRQVFSEKNGFLNDLSIIDYLFNNSGKSL